MRICWLAPYPINHLLPEIKLSGFPSPGYGMWLINLASILAERNEIELHIITHSSKVFFDQRITKNNIHFHILRYSFYKDKGYPSYLPAQKLFWYYPLVKKIKKLIRDIAPEIIHAHGTESVYSFAAIKTGLPTLISIQGIITEILKVNFNVNYFLQKPIEKYCVKHGEYFGIRTEFDKSFVISINKKAKLFYLPEIISPLFFQVKWYGINNLNTIVFNGRLTRIKGLEILIDALHKLDQQNFNFKVIVIGEGSSNYKKHIKTKITNLWLDSKFEFKGFLDQKNISKILANSGIYIHSSLIDNSPNSLCEAMAVGIPVIASNVGGIPSLVENNVNGLLFSVGDPSDLNKQILKLVNDKNLALTLSKKSSEEVKKRNHPSNVIDKTISVYQKVIKLNKLIK